MNANDTSLHAIHRMSKQGDHQPSSSGNHSDVGRNGQSRRPRPPPMFVRFVSRRDAEAGSNSNVLPCRLSVDKDLSVIIQGKLRAAQKKAKELRIH